MAKLTEEKRMFARVKVDLKVGGSIGQDAFARDLSEAGLRLESKDVISSPAIFLKIDFPGQEPQLEAGAKLVWKRDLADGNCSYGVEFINLNESQKALLRRELVKAQIKGLVENIEEGKTKDDVSRFFMTDMLNYLNEMNKVIAGLSKDNTYSYEVEKKIAHLNTCILLKGYCLEQIIEDKTVINKSKEHFRALAGSWVYKSLIVKRALEKPRGYPGDYLLLEIIYNNCPLTKEGIGFYVDRNFLNSPYACAVRYRKDKIRDTLKEALAVSKLSPMKVFNVACGSCREIKELPVKLFQNKKVEFCCLDWDQEALDFAGKAVSHFPDNVVFNFIKEDIMHLIKNKCRFNKQHLIYSIGLIDYLPDRVLKVFMRFFYELLQKEGKLILTHKNREKNFSPLTPDWFCNWKFVPRNKEEIARLFYNCGIKDFSLVTESDDFNDVFYFTLTKLK